MEITALTDTITIANETLNLSDLIDPYKELIKAQRANYNTIITVFVAILAILGAFVGIIYYQKTKDWIQKNTKNIFDEERKNIINSIKEEYDKKFKELREDQDKKFTDIEATSARLFATTIEDKDPANKMIWWLISLENYIALNQGDFIRISVLSIMNLCGLLKKDDTLKKTFIGDSKIKLIDNHRYSFEYSINIFEKIPDTLTDERNEIKEFYNSIKDEISIEETKKKTVRKRAVIKTKTTKS